MLSSTRRSLTRFSSSSFQDLRCFVVGSSKDLLEPSATTTRTFTSTTIQSARKEVQIKLSKTKSLERSKKLEKKRSLRAIKVIKDENRNEDGRLKLIEKGLEVDSKFENAQVSSLSLSFALCLIAQCEEKKMLCFYLRANYFPTLV